MLDTINDVKDKNLALHILNLYSSNYVENPIIPDIDR